MRGTAGAIAPVQDSGAEALDDDASTTMPAPVRRPPPVEEPPRGRVQPEPPVERLADLPEEDGETLANAAAAPLETGVPRPEETDPFSATGFRAGTSNVFLRLEQSLGYSSNTAKEPGGKAGGISVTSGNLRAQSDWSLHEATIEASASVEKGFNEGDQAIPEADVEGRLRLDLVDGYAVNLRAGYDFNTEDGGSAGSGERYDVQEFGGSAELLRGARKLELSIKGSADRTIYGDLPGTGAQDDRNNTLYQFTARAGYELSPALKPYFQSAIGRRLYDGNSLQSDGTLYELRAGVAVDLGEKLRGEAAIGYLTEDYDDAGVETARTPTLNANLFWSPVRGTEVTLSAATGLDSASAAGQSGSVSQSLGFTTRTAVTHRLAIVSEGSLDLDNYDNGTSDTTWNIGAGIEYAISRTLALTADIGHEQFNSAVKSGSWDATTVTVGVALQR
ncbi:MAG TPA: outer membrane beta-barrel protein [Rhizobiaceae bacterium]|nr:outer membrane beta-barrel protein [Rhizobiaceae bacterium]